MQACLSCLLYLLKAKEQYIGYTWVAVALSSTLWVVLILEHRFYYLLTIVFQLQYNLYMC